MSDNNLLSLANRMEKNANELLLLAAKVKRILKQSNLDAVIESDPTKVRSDSKMILPITLGTKTNGDVDIVDLERMPHLLIGGTSPKVMTDFLKTIVCGLIEKTTPEEVRVALYNKQSAKFSCFEEMTHLLSPIFSVRSKFITFLKWTVAEMDRRYTLFIKEHCRTISEYNVTTDEKLPFIVVVIDEFSDLMKKSDDFMPLISRLAVMSRPAGIHLILSTNKINSNNLKAELKVNIPDRIAFKTKTASASQLILDAKGAEALKEDDDILIRHCDNPVEQYRATIYSDADVKKSLKKSIANYPGSRRLVKKATSQRNRNDDDSEADFKKVIDLLIKSRKISVAHIQRKLGFGYNHAEKMVDLLEERGIVGPKRKTINREIFWDHVQQAGD